MAVMTGNAIREALEPIAKAASILTDDGGWRETDVLELIAENGDREYVGSLTVGDLRRARPAYDAIGSGVKALEWEEEDGDFTAVTVLGWYHIGRPASVWNVLIPPHESHSFETLSEAKAAAQADFERRVLSCLSTHTAAEARPSDDRLWDQTLAERDNYHDAADKLAEAIGELLGVNVGEHSSAHSPWETALEHAGQAVRNRAISTHTAAGAGPVDRIDLEAMLKPLDGYDKNQPGYQHREGWNDAILYVMDVRRAAAGAAAEFDAVYEPELRARLRGGSL